MTLRSLRRGIALFGAIAISSVLAACGPAAQQAPAGDKATQGDGKVDIASQGTPKPGGILRQTLFNVAPSWDIISEGTQATQIPIQPMYNQLLQYDPLEHNGLPAKIIPDLAEKWDASSDGLIYTFTLRQGVKWHDGKEFTSEDVKFSIDRHANPPKGVPSLRGEWYKGVEVQTPDKYTAKFVLSEPNAAFLKTIATAYTPMVPKHVLDGKGRITTMDLVVGTGPYKLVKADRNVGYTLEKNKEYYLKDKPYLDGIEFTVVLEESSRVAAVRTNAVDCVCGTSLSKPSYESLEKAMGDKVVYRTGIPGISFSSIQLNNKVKPFDDPRVRKAISMIIDRPTIVKIAADGDGDMGSYMPPKGQWGIPSEEMAKRPGFHTPTSQDIEAAKKLLADAGYPNGIEIVSNNGYGTAQDRTNELLVEMLKPLGVKLNIRQLERTAYYAALDNRDFQMAPMGHAHSIDDPNDHIATYLISGGGRNYSQFSDPKVDAMYKEQARTLDPEKRKQIVRDLENYLLEQMPFLVTNWNAGGRDMWYKYVKGYNPMSSFTAFRKENVWLDK